MRDIELIAHHYRDFKFTKILEKDIKSICKINNILQKYRRTQKLSYIFEVINIISTLNNTLDVKKSKDNLLEFIDEEKQTVTFIIDHIEKINLNMLRAEGIVTNEI